MDNPKTLADLECATNSDVELEGGDVINREDVQDLLRERIKELEFIMDEEFKGDDISPSEEWMKAYYARDELVRLLGDKE